MWEAYPDKLIGLIQELRPKSILDIGGGRNPKLSLSQAQELCERYAVLDVDQGELDLADDGYETILGDASNPPEITKGQFDFVFSRMVAEHVADGRAFHEGVYSMLRPGGVAFHFFPTLYSLPFLANWLIPNAVADRVLDLIAPRDRDEQDKFPPHYSWTFGPTNRQIARIESVGFEIVEYTAGFGHRYYNNLPVIRTVGAKLHDALARRPVWSLSSYASLVVRRPLTD